MSQVDRVSEFRSLNVAGNLLLPNAWDAASARIFEQAGFPAIGTTSAGIAYSRGLRDAQKISRDAMMREIASIVSAVRVPVTADVEAGYGPLPSDVSATVEAALEAGVAGINLEDNAHGGRSTPLFRVEEQIARIRAARQAGDQLVINARTDTFLLELGSNMEERVGLTIERGRAYLAAGADLIFVPLAVNPKIVKQLATGMNGPISVMAMPGAASAGELFEAGAKRVSLGQTAMLATMGLLNQIAQEIKSSGTWTSINRRFYGFGEAEQLFRS